MGIFLINGNQRWTQFTNNTMISHEIYKIYFLWNFKSLLVMYQSLHAADTFFACHVVILTCSRYLLSFYIKLYMLNNIFIYILYSKFLFYNNVWITKKTILTVNINFK